MLQTHVFDGNGRQINAAATFFRYESGSAGGADESIRVRADGQDLGLYFPGDSVELPTQSSTWEIAPVSPTCRGIVRVGVGRVSSARLVGTVRVVDSERDKVGSGVCFRAGINKTGDATGGACTQIYNPAGSGKNLLVQAVRLGASAADSWTVGVGPGLLPAVYANLPVNLDVTGPAAVAVSRTGTSGDISGGKSLVSGYVGASQDVVVLFPRPILVRPGYGVLVYVNTNATTIRTGWEWEEWPV